MHILATSATTLDDLVEPVDLRQQPGDVVVLSFSDSDLAGLAAAHRRMAEAQTPESPPASPPGSPPASPPPSLRLASLRHLRHPLSVDLWIDAVGAKAKVIVVRLLGGHDWWRYGCDRLAQVARAKGIALALLPGECRERDERLLAASTLPEGEIDALLAYFREGGPDNMRALIDRLAALAGHARRFDEARPLPRAGLRRAAQDGVAAVTDSGRPVVPILFYRSMLLADDAAPVEALAAALSALGIAAMPIYVSSLKDEACAAFAERAMAEARPALIVTATAFAAADAGAETLFDRLGVPVLQAIMASCGRDAWAASTRGLGPADLAMHVVMPELDGRLHAGAISFKAESEPSAALGFRGRFNQAWPDGIAALAERVAALLRLQATPRAERRLAVLMPDYPAAAGRAGYAVGLDVPASVRAMLHDLGEAGYSVTGVPASERALLDRLDGREAMLPLAAYVALLAGLDGQAVAAVRAAWGEAAADPDVADGAFRFRAARFGNSTVALAPDRGRAGTRRADYHDPALPPRHALVAFGLWLRHGLDAHAVVHMGAHGTLEWLPGKAVALSPACFPQLVTGPLPLVYPFIVSNPGEAAQAKRRIGAVTLGHLPPPLLCAGEGLGDQGLEDDAQSSSQRRLERLVDEYVQADGLDPNRRRRLAALIVATARRSGLAREAGVRDDHDPDTALRRIDAWLCDLKDLDIQNLAIKDGLHIFGRAAPGEADPLRIASGEAERRALIAALDGRHVAPGPAGAPARGRRDVLPTGRNLYGLDPRSLPTPTAYDLGRLAADEVLRRYVQDHGEFPRSLVLDLWGSASLRTGGEDIAHGLALMGCRPQWDAASGRVTGIAVLPPAALSHPRVDVTFRISGLFRDLFAAQIALLDAAARAVAARDETQADNPLAAAARRAGAVPARVFGAAPGRYGAGIEDQLAAGSWETRQELGLAYLAAASHAYAGSDGEAAPAPGAFADRVAAADLLVHMGDDPGRDLLEGSADVAFLGGFAAAAAALGTAADLVHLDSTDPRRPRARSVVEAVTRVVRGRAIHPRFIAGQLRHGPRGAAEFAETVDRLVGFAETTGAIPSSLIDAVHDAYLGDATVRGFIARENPAALAAIAARFAAARRRGLWHPRRNAVDADLAALTGEAAP